MNNFGKNLAALRQMAGYSQREFAIELKISDSTLSRYENGCRKPKKNLCIKMANLLGVSPADLIYGEV